MADDLQNGRSVLFTGFPCMVAALNRYIRKASVTGGSLLTMDLICHGPASPLVAKEYAAMMEKKYKSPVADLTVKYKKDGQWIPPYLKVSFTNGKSTMRPFTATEYGFAFRVLARERCYSCKFKGQNHESDITMGDYWGVRSTDAGFNPHGVSAAIAHTEQGDQRLRNLQNFQLTAIKYEDVIRENPYYESPRPRDSRHEKFEGLLKTEGLRKACRACMTAKESIRKYIPQSFVNLMHKVSK